MTTSDSKQPVLIIIAGPNGSGKTTITSQILKHSWLEDCIYINPDEIAQNKFGSWSDKESILKAANYAETLRRDSIKNRKSLIFETVFSANEKVDFLLEAKKQGYFIRFFFVTTSHPLINVTRVARRVMEGGHDVPISKIISRYQKSFINSASICRIVDRFYFFDNSIDFEKAKLIFRASNGSLIKKYSNIPNWILPILNELKTN
ncbi:MAG: zeta toxin family protein [Fluviicola sp.]|jgi:predicted ABC-type ATPase